MESDKINLILTSATNSILIRLYYIIFQLNLTIYQKSHDHL